MKMDNSNFNVRLSESWDVGKEYFTKPLTFAIEPTSITGQVSDFDIDIKIKMSNGDNITYVYKDNGAGGPCNKTRCEMRINDGRVKVDPENGFLDEIREKYFKYLKAK